MTDEKLKEIATQAVNELQKLIPKIGADTPEDWMDPILAALDAAAAEAIERAAMLHESIDCHCDHEPAAGAGAMRAVIEYRDAIRALAAPQQAGCLECGHARHWFQACPGPCLCPSGEPPSQQAEQPDLPLGHEFEPCPSLMPDGFPARFCVLKSPKQTECHFWHLHPAHYCGQPESAHRRKP